MGRFERQIKLPQVGREGQARIQRANLRHTCSDPSTNEMALLYARAVGLGVSSLGEGASELPLPDALRDVFRHSSARTVGHGAALALKSVLDALEEKPRTSKDDPT